MGAVRSFEELVAWGKGRELVKAIYQVSGRGAFAQDYGLKDQIRRASVSITSNIAEGFERGGDKEFRQFLSQAKASAGEVRSQLYTALDVGYLTEPEFERLFSLTTETSRTISGLIQYLGRSEMKGSKRKEI